MNGTWTAQELADALNERKLRILRRSDREQWPFEWAISRGGKTKMFAFTDLPADIQIKLLPASAPAPAVVCGVGPDHPHPPEWRA